MKELIATFLIIGNLVVAPVHVKSDYQIVFDYCDTYFSTYTVCIFTEWDEEVMCNRANTNIVYVEKCTSYSSGSNFGYTKEGYFIRYNKVVPKGQEVISYFVYNPNTNYFDDVILAVDNGLIR